MERIYGTVKVGTKKANRKQFIFIRRLIAFSFLMIGLLTMFSFASDLFDEEKRMESIQKEIEKYEKIEVVIHEGDRAWNIQKALTPNEDTRDMLYLVESLNHKRSMGEIKAGEVIVFLKLKRVN